ncbi:hypothetical protein RN001_003000 [Aquatica leii]|uniref:GATA zinc finger domain-containing protein 14-like n=1 Tax=Aquatica leii TaxID=1421715 RepID=A0AAN7Q5U9_9COLE|nr:hypothetical protein RN001_003000 [Aquatica leii]
MLGVKIQLVLMMTLYAFRGDAASIKKTIDQDPSQNKITTEAPKSSNKKSPPAIIAIEIIDEPQKNGTGKNNSKRTIESSLGYGYQGPLNSYNHEDNHHGKKFVIYKYSQQDIPSSSQYSSFEYNRPNNYQTDIQKSIDYHLGSVTSYANHNPSIKNESPDILYRTPTQPQSQSYNTGNTFYTTFDQQGLGGFSNQVPHQSQAQTGLVPVIFLKVYSNQLTNQNLPLYTNLPQSHQYSDLNSINLQAYLQNYLQQYLQSEQAVYQPTYQQPQQAYVQNYQVRNNYQPNLPSYENYPSEQHTKVVFPSSNKAQDPLKKIYKTLGLSAYKSVSYPMYVAPQQSESSVKLEQPNVQYAYSTDNKNVDQRYLYMHSDNTYEPVYYQDNVEYYQAADNYEDNSNVGVQETTVQPYNYHAHAIPQATKEKRSNALEIASTSQSSETIEASFAQGYKYGMVQEGIYRTSNSHNERNNFRDYRYQQDQPRFGQNWYNNSRFREKNRNQQGYHNYNFREHGYRNNFNRNFSNNENNYNQSRNREGNQNQNGHNENRERRHYNEDRRESNFRLNRTFENNNVQSEENNQIQGRGRGCRGPQRGRAYYINNMNLREVEENNHCGSNNEEEEVINETVTVTANNKNIKIVNNMVVGNLKMGNTEHSHGLIMMNNMRMDCLLGIDPLEKFKVKLDLEKKIIEINKEESNLKKSEEYNGLMMSIKLNNMNEANEEDIKINCPDDKKEEIESLLNESPGLFHDEQRIMLYVFRGDTASITTTSDDASSVNKTTEALMFPNKTSPAAIVAIEIIDEPQEYNNTEKNNTKRTIESSLGYGYQEPVNSYYNQDNYNRNKFALSSYSEKDTQSPIRYSFFQYNNPYNLHTDIKKDQTDSKTVTTHSNHKPSTKKKSSKPKTRKHKTQNTLYTTYDLKNIGGLSNQIPTTHSGLVPVIFLRVYSKQLSNPNLALYTNVPQSHQYADLNSINLQNYLQQYLESQEVVYEPTYRNSQQTHVQNYRLPENYQTNVPSYKNTRSKQHNKLGFRSNSNAQESLPKTSTTPNYSVYNPILHPIYITSQQSKSNNELQQPNIQYVYNNNNENLNQEYKYEFPESTYQHIYQNENNYDQTVDNYEDTSNEDVEESTFYQTNSKTKKTKERRNNPSTTFHKLKKIKTEVVS